MGCACFAVLLNRAYGFSFWQISWSLMNSIYYCYFNRDRLYGYFIFIAESSEFSYLLVFGLSYVAPAVGVYLFCVQVNRLVIDLKFCCSNSHAKVCSISHLTNKSLLGHIFITRFGALVEIKLTKELITVIFKQYQCYSHYSSLSENVFIH